MKADLHIHSSYSPDAISKPESILEAAASHGIGMIAITDHDTTYGWNHFQEASKKYPVHVVRGQEVKIYKDTFLAGELLCLFLDKPIGGTTVSEVIQEVTSQGGIVSIAHPFSERRAEFRAYTEIDDWQNIAIEVKNGRSYNQRDDEMAVSLADRIGAPITAGSDAHTPFEIGSVYLEFNGSTENQLKNAIRSREVKACGHAASALFSLLSGLGRLGLAV